MEKWLLTFVFLFRAFYFRLQLCQTTIFLSLSVSLSLCLCFVVSLLVSKHNSCEITKLLGNTAYGMTTWLVSKNCCEVLVLIDFSDCDNVMVLLKGVFGLDQFSDPCSNSNVSR